VIQIADVGKKFHLRSKVPQASPDFQQVDFVLLSADMGFEGATVDKELSKINKFFNRSHQEYIATMNV
jgi:hypothetical protein